MASPILTRLYSPTDFAQIALFSAIVSSIAVAACGRYDVAVVVAKSEINAARLLALSFWVAALVSSIMLIGLLKEDKFFQYFLNFHSLGIWLFITPIMVFLNAFGTALKYYANRNKDYQFISSIGVCAAFSAASLSIILGISNFYGNGLIISALVSGFLTTIFFCFKYKKVLLSQYKWQPKNLARIAVQYKKFPLYDATASLLDNVTLGLPIFFLTKNFSETTVGCYALLLKVATAPLGFLSQAISEVHIRKIAEIVHLKKNPTQYLKILTIFLTGIILIPTAIFMFKGPDIFALFFGEPWRLAGKLLVILMPALALRFIVSTVSGVFAATGNNYIGAFWKVFAFCITFVMFCLLAEKTTVEKIFYAMLVTDLFLYSLYYYLIWHAVKNPKITK